MARRNKLFDDDVIASPARPKKLASDLVQHGNDTFDIIVERYISARQRFWEQEDFTVADAQLTLDAMGEMAAIALKANALLGTQINAIRPGTLTDDELAIPVAYTVVGDRIVLDVDGTYPGPLVEASEEPLIGD